MGTVFADPQNVTSFFQKIVYINSLTDVGFGGVIGLSILMVVGFGLFFMMKAFRFEGALTVSLFITSFIAVLLRIYTLINDWTLYATIILFVVSFFYLKKSSNGL